MKKRHFLGALVFQSSLASSTLDWPKNKALCVELEE
jgi:hypothetical protein